MGGVGGAAAEGVVVHPDQFLQPALHVGRERRVFKGFVGVDATVRGETYRFVNTHLEGAQPDPDDPNSAIIQSLQAAELEEWRLGRRRDAGFRCRANWMTTEGFHSLASWEGQPTAMQFYMMPA